MFESVLLRNLQYVPQKTSCMSCINYFYFFFIDFFRKQQGSSPYVIPLGGSSYMGAFGYLTAFQEMMHQVEYCSHRYFLCLTQLNVLTANALNYFKANL